MAEILSSAVVGETVTRIASTIIGTDQDKSNISENIERLEIAHIKMDAALHMSDKWQISDAPLVQWRNKLKRAAQECGDKLHECKQHALEVKEIRERVRKSSFPRRIAHATKSLVSPFIPFGNDGSVATIAQVRRFERFADGANEFLRFVEFGGTPRQYMFFNPLTRDLLEGKIVRYQVLQGSRYRYFGIRPIKLTERGVEAMLGFVDHDFKVPTKGFSLGLMLRLSESTDIFGIITKSMQSVAPHFRFAAEAVRKEIIQLPTQDFSCFPDSPYTENQYWTSVHNTLTQWFRPDPRCCNEHGHDLRTSTSSTSNAIELSSSSKLLCDIFPEEVIVVHLQCHVSLPNQQSSRQSLATAPDHGHGVLPSSMNPLKLGILFIPHDSPEDIEPSAESYALEVIDEREQGTIHLNARLQDLDEWLLPKAIDYLYQNAESNMYQMCLKTRHGTGHLCVEKTTTTEIKCIHRRNTGRHARNRSLTQKLDSCRMEEWKKVARDLLKLWVVRESDKLKGSIRSWTSVRKLD